MQQRSEQEAKAARLRRLKVLAVTATASTGMLIWGAVSGTIAATTPAATSTPQPVTRDTQANSGFFNAQDPAPGLSQTTITPATRTGGS